MASSNSPCAACKFLRRKCTQECVFAPYFPPDQPQRFSNVHKVFGASNIAKLLNELSPTQREDAVISLAYEAEARLKDPVYGCVGLISYLQYKLKEVQDDLDAAKKELSSYIGPSAMLPFGHPHYPMLHHAHHLGASSSMNPFGLSPMGLGLQPPSQALMIREQQQHHQLLEAQQLAAIAAREQHEMMRNYEQQQQQQELVRFNSSFDGGGGSGGQGYNQIGAHSQLALVPFENPYQVQEQEHIHQQPHHHQRTGSDEGKSGIGPSS